MAEQRLATTSPEVQGKTVAYFGGVYIDHIWDLGEKEVGAGSANYADSYTEQLGGKALNGVRSARSLSQNPNDVFYFVGQAGRDSEGRAAKAQLAEEGINTEFLRLHPDLKTAIVSVFLTNDKDAAVISSRDRADDDLNIRRIDNFAYKIKKRGEKLDHICTALDSPIPIMERIAQLALQNDIPVLCDLGADRRGARPILYGDILTYFDILTANRSEAEAFSGVKNIDSDERAEIAVRKMLWGYPFPKELRYSGKTKEAILTRGSDGITYGANTPSNDLKIFHIPAFPLRHKVSTLKAGDIARAAFLNRRLAGEETYQSLVFATQAAAFGLANPKEKIIYEKVVDWADSM